MLLLVMTLVACRSGDDPPPSSVDTDLDTDTASEADVEPIDCTLPEMPWAFETIEGFTQAEDFAFDLDGNYVATDNAGNVVKIPRDGSDRQVFVPGFGEAAGTVYTAGGDLVIANLERGSLERITPEGGQETLLGGLAYPNGVTADSDGVVYVAEQNGGRVRWIDTVTGEDGVIGEDLFAPNGLALGPDHETLYITSFGGGTVHVAEKRANGNWKNPELFGITPSGTTPPTVDPTCEGQEVGEECFLPFLGIGVCADDGGGIFCAEHRDVEACEGKGLYDRCDTVALGEAVSSICSVDEDSEQLFCPKVPGDAVEECIGKDEDDPCEVDDVHRSCRVTWEDVLVCDLTQWEVVAREACTDLDPGDDCVVKDFEGYAEGSCQEAYGDLYCEPGWYGGGGYQFHGGLDGITVDQCGNVYVTEYTYGYIWHFPPDNDPYEPPNLAVATERFWIPNMHFGNDIGGWDPSVMYVQDRDTEQMLAVPMPIPGVPAGFQP